GEVATEQPIRALPLRDEVDPEVAHEEQVGLSALDHHARWHASVVQIPRVFADVGLGLNTARLQTRRLRIEPRDAVAQKQRRLGHPHLYGVAVLRGEFGAEQLRDLPTGEVLEVFAG